jgi:ribosomal protein S6E (S10)
MKFFEISHVIFCGQDHDPAPMRPDLNLPRRPRLRQQATRRRERPGETGLRLLRGLGVGVGHC